MFFQRKKEKVAQEKPLKYYISVSACETEFTCSVSYTEGMHNTKFTEIGYTLMDAVLSGYCVFTVRHILGNPEELERCLAYLKQEPTAEFISDEKEMIIEKGNGVSSLLLKDCFHNVEPGEWSFPMNDFERYGYQKDVQMKETAEEQYAFLEKESPDICVDYEDHFEELQCLSFIIKREVLSPEDFAVLAIQVCRKYGKEVELHYQEKGYM